MENLLYMVNGKLNKGFVGHITYITVIPENIGEIKLSFVFNKREAENKEELKDRAIKTLNSYNERLENKNQLAEYFVTKAKTEINMSVFIDDFCLGSAHRDEIEKLVTISSNYSSNGFVRYKPSGVLKIVLHSLVVLNDNTEYSLNVEGR